LEGDADSTGTSMSGTFSTPVIGGTFSGTKKVT